MKMIKTAVAAAVLVAAPTLGFAMCSFGEHKNTTAASCAEGMVWDATSGQCVTSATS